MTIDSRRRLYYFWLVVLVGWAVYTTVLTTGHFLSLLPKYRGESAWLILVGLAFVIVLSAWRSIPASSGDTLRPPVASFVLLAAAFVILAFALYAGALSLGLLSDDFVLLGWAAKHQFVVRSWYLRPLPLLVWAIAESTGRADWLLHVLNVLLHGVNAALVVVLASRLGLSKLASVCAGAVFVCFPGSVEAVAWASGMQDVLLTTCCLAFVLASGFREQPDLVLPLSMLALLGALACKETAVAAPLLAFVAWFGTQDRWDARPIAWGLLLTGVYAALRLWAFAVDSSFMVAPSRYFAKELVSQMFSSLAVPFTGSELLRSPAFGILMAWLFAALLVDAVWRARTDRRFAIRMARCTVWVLVPALPVWSAFFISADLQGSRYLYLPACGWSVLMGMLLLDRQRRAARDVGVAVAAVLLFAWSLGVRSHLSDWQEAAQIRDRVLESAVSRLQHSPCAVVGFTHVPDSARGAYVFRNGLLEALERRGVLRAKLTMGDSDEAGCTLRWQDRAFQ